MLQTNEVYTWCACLYFFKFLFDSLKMLLQWVRTCNCVACKVNNYGRHAVLGVYTDV